MIKRLDVNVQLRLQLMDRHERMAIQLRRESRYWEAKFHITRAIDILSELTDDSMLFVGDEYDASLPSSMHRRQILKLDCNFDFNHFQKNGGKIIELISVPGFSFNYDYLKMYEKYCSAEVKEVIIYERFVWIGDQIDNMKRLLMMLKSYCVNLKFAMFKCTKSLLSSKQLEDLKLDMSAIDINFEYESLVFGKANDHKVVFNNGYVFCFRNGFDLNDYFDPFSNKENEICVWKATPAAF